MKKLHLWLGALLLAALVLSACGSSAPASGGGAPAPSGAKPTAAAQQPQQPSQPQQQAPANEPDQSNTAKDLLDLKDVTEGLGSLDSYKSSFTMSFDGTEDKQPKQWSMTVEEEFVKNPPAKRSTIKSTGTDASGGESFIQTIQVNGKQYTTFGDTCASSDSTETPTASASLSPSNIIGDIRGTQLLGTETVNGVPTQHYAVDLTHFASLLQYSNAKGETWIAQQGNYVVKYTFEATGKDAFFGGTTDTEGTIRWTYEVNDVNQLIDIKPPENCGGAPSDVPVMSDAQDRSSFGNIVSYTSPSSFDDVVAFYKKEMAGNGWQEQEGGMSAEGFAMLSFTKADRKASITLTADKDKNVTSVLISLEGPSK